MYNHVPNVNKANTILAVRIMIDQILSSQLSKHLIQDLDCSIAVNKGFVLALNYEIRLLKLNDLKHIKVHYFQFKSNDLLHQFTSMEFNELTMAIHRLVKQ